jgi:DNA topoisomerase-2
MTQSISKMIDQWENMIVSENSLTQSSASSTDFASLLPTAMKISSKTISQDLGFATQEEIDAVKSEVIKENREGRIGEIIENKEHKDIILEQEQQILLYSIHMAKSNEQNYQKLDEISHVLLRPGMYIGSIKPHSSPKFVCDGDKMVSKEITFIPGFLKLFDEILMNSVDEFKRKGSKLNIIKVTVKDNIITVWDNGGIPVLKHKEHKEWIPEMIFSNLRSGSNFDDTENREGSGTNGVGSSITNIYSKEFRISTCDGKNRFVQTYNNNMRKRTNPKITPSGRNHTEISYEPDYEKFSLKNLDATHFDLIKKRTIDIAGCNPALKIYFNDVLINIKSFEDYIKYYTPEVFFETNKKWSIGVSLSEDGFKQVSFVNSTETYDGGTHVDYVLNQIISKLREYFLKKHKTDVKPSEIKNHMSFFLNSVIINPAFSSQTKEKLITEVKDFGFTYDVPDSFINKILKSEIVESILDWIKKKQEADENKELRKLNKNLDKTKIERLIDAKGKDRSKCVLYIFEGLSAATFFRKLRDTQTMGAYTLKGKPLNAMDLKPTQIMQDTEILGLMGAIGLKLGEEPLGLRYGRIIITADADVDGSSITALLISFFHRFWPDLFEMNILFKAETPIVVATKGKESLSFYNTDEYNNWVKKGKNVKSYELSYKKGLAALSDVDAQEILSDPKLTKILKDKTSGEKLEVWFGKDSELRKKELLNEQD